LYLRIFLSIVLCLILTGSALAEGLVFSKIAGNPAYISEVILKEAYRRLGIEISTNILPGERALKSANAGELDGDIHRVIGLEKIYPNLIRVPFAVNSLEGMIFTKNRDLSVNSWDDLKPYSIGLRTGMKFAELGTRGMNVTSVEKTDQLFKMIESNRLDVIVSTRIEGLMLTKQMKLDDVFPVEPPIVDLKLFHYVHKKHEALIPKLVQVLNDMAKEGLILELRQKSLLEILDQ
jgi:polar amino acid transport system substrate-binding protein